jgi:beta-galactosidase/beta-glucuronidase
MPTHRMHLKGPWNTRWLNRDEPARQVVMPSDWQSLFGDEAGTVEFRRKFNQPTNLEPHEHVWVVFDGILGAAQARLNGQRLGRIADNVTTAEFEITPHLRLHNELVVELTFDPQSAGGVPGGLWGPVALEIRFEQDNAVVPT